MSEQNQEMTPEEEPQQKVPQDVADELSVLASELRADEARAARGWKITAIIWVVILAVIASYLYFGVYRMLKGYTEEPGTLIEFAVISPAKEALDQQGVPWPASRQFTAWATQKLKDRAPEVMRNQVKPELEKLKGRVPELRKEAVAEIKARAPELMDQALSRLQADLLPRARQELIGRAGRELDSALSQVDQQMQQAVSEALAQVKGDVETMTDEQKLRVAMRSAFQDAMGPVLNEMLGKVQQAVRNARQQLEQLVQSLEERKLTRRQMLEIRLVQLVRHMFEQRGALEGPDILAQLREGLQKFELPQVTRARIVKKARAGQMPDLEGVPEEHRAKVKQMIKEAMARATAAQKRAEPQAAPETPPAGPGAMPQIELPDEVPPEARKQIEEALKARAARQGAEEAPAPSEIPEVEIPENVPPEARKKIEEALKKAREQQAQAEQEQAE